MKETKNVEPESNQAKELPQGQFNHVVSNRCVLGSQRTEPYSRMRRIREQ